MSQENLPEKGGGKGGNIGGLKSSVGDLTKNVTIFNDINNLESLKPFPKGKYAHKDLGRKTGNNEEEI